MAEWEPAGTLRVERCAPRRPHTGLVVRPLTHATDEWTEWTLCPTTGEPILICLEATSSGTRRRVAADRHADAAPRGPIARNVCTMITDPDAARGDAPRPLCSPWTRRTQV